MVKQLMPTFFLDQNVQHAFLTSTCYVILTLEPITIKNAFFHSWPFMKHLYFLNKFNLVDLMHYHLSFGSPLLCLDLRFAKNGRVIHLPEG